MSADIPGYIYAGIVAAGGVLGYYKARSVPSLGAGLFFGGVLTYGAYEVSRNPGNYHLQLGASSILATIMGYRFFKSKKIMPSGAVCLLSIAMIIRFAGRALALSSDLPDSEL